MQTGVLVENLKKRYDSSLRKKLMADLGKENVFQVPKLKKIVVNIGFGKMSPDEKAREQIADYLARITGQKPLFTKARKSIAGFKIREGQIVGAKVTLRGARMYHFLEKLISIVLPRLRDFRGIPDNAFDGSGNYTLGFSEINVFPEVDYSKGEKPIGLEVVIASTAKTDADAKVLLSGLGMPFKEQKETRVGSKNG
jgi:large subunit ribosomal protein L5